MLDILIGSLVDLLAYWYLLPDFMRQNRIRRKVISTRRQMADSVGGKFDESSTKVLEAMASSYCSSMPLAFQPDGRQTYPIPLSV